MHYVYFCYSTNLLKILLFKRKKPFSKMPKGWKSLGSPDRTILELFA
jgi:hypothetical protein